MRKKIQIHQFTDLLIYRFSDIPIYCFTGLPYPFQLSAMHDEVLVKVEGVSKKFCRDLKRSLWYGVKDISSDLFGADKNNQLQNLTVTQSGTQWSEESLNNKESYSCNRFFVLVPRTLNDVS